MPQKILILFIASITFFGASPNFLIEQTSLEKNHSKFLNSVIPSFLIQTVFANEKEQEKVADPSKTTDKPFRLHLNIEPSSLNIAKLKGSGAHFLFSALHRTLYQYNTKSELQPNLLSSCRWKNNTTLHCTVDKEARWSDGSSIVADDIARTFFYLIDPKNNGFRTDLLLTLNNAQSILKGELPASKLGVKIIDPKSIEFVFTKKDPEFLDKLTSHILSPIKTIDFPEIESATHFISSGPYKISSWEVKKKIRLEPNPYYKGFEKRPPVEFYFISEDAVALQLYEKGELDFLRRLPTSLIAKYKNRNDFIQVPVARFDYLGFGPQLKSFRELRKALALSINYEEWQKLLSALGPPGCFSLPEKFFTQNPCLKMNLDEAHLALQKTISEIKTSKSPLNIEQLVLNYSSQGGDDQRKSMNWVQEQWRTHLNLNVKVQPEENALFVKHLTEKTPSIFRKGISLDYLSCYNAVQNFLPQAKENFIQLDNAKINTNIDHLLHAKTEAEQKQYCTTILNLLIDDFWIIPLGRMHFTILMQPKWKGWTLNELFVLDLSQLHKE